MLPGDVPRMLYGGSPYDMSASPGSSSHPHSPSPHPFFPLDYDPAQHFLMPPAPHTPGQVRAALLLPPCSPA